MGEVKRKFLVNYIPNLNCIDSSNIIEGYLSLSPEVKIIKDELYFYLVKSSDDKIIREDISANIFNILKETVISNLIKIRRYFILLDSSQNAVLDVYYGSLDGLITVEVELDESNNFVIPDWFGKEITDDIRYDSKNLISISSIDDLDKKKKGKRLIKEDK